MKKIKKIVIIFSVVTIIGSLLFGGWLINDDITLINQTNVSETKKILKRYDLVNQLENNLDVNAFYQLIPKDNNYEYSIDERKLANELKRAIKASLATITSFKNNISQYKITAYYKIIDNQIYVDINWYRETNMQFYDQLVISLSY